MRRGVLPILVVLMVAAACSSFDADDPGTPTPDGGTSSSGGVNDGGSNEGGFVLPEAGPCVGDCPPVTIGRFKAYDAFGIGVSDAHVAWYFQGVNQQANLQWCTKSDGSCNGGNSYPGAGSSIVGAPEAVYAAVTGGASGRIVRLGPAGLQEIIKADLSDPDAAKFDSPSYLFAGPAGLDFYDYSGLPSAIGVFRLDRDAGLPTPQQLGSLDTANAHRWQRLETVGPNTFLFEYFGIARVTRAPSPRITAPTTAAARSGSST